MGAEPDHSDGHASTPISADAVLSVLRHAALQLERTPGFLETAGEEGIRDALLVALNGALAGQAFGEAYNRRGKTDILVRDRDRNVFLVECKIYGGPKGVTDAVEQLLGYTGWRERRVGLLMFVRSHTMTTGIRGTKKGLDDSEAVRHFRDVDGEGSEIRADAIHPEDPEVSLRMDVLLAYLPVRSDRRELAGGDIKGVEESADPERESATQVPRTEDEIAYQRHAGPPELELPGHPDTMLRLERITDQGREAIDAVPLSPEALQQHAPTGALVFDDPKAAEEGARALRRAAKDLVAIEVPGARVRFDRVPPPFREAAERLAQADPAHITVRLAPRGMWQTRFKIDTNRGTVDVPIAFAAIEPPDDSDVSARGTFHNLTMTMRLKRGGELNLDWSLKPTDAPIRERLAALDFLYALTGRGTLEWISLDPPFPPQSLELGEAPFHPDNEFERWLFGELVTIEDHVGVRFELPEEIDRDQLAAIATAAKTIREGTAAVIVSTVTFSVAPSSLSVGDEVEVKAPIPVDIEILGRDFRLGLGTGELRGRVEAVERQQEGSDHVTLVPRDDQARRVIVENLRPVPPGGEEEPNAAEGDSSARG